MIRISKPIVREVDRKVFLVSYMSDNKSKTEVNPNGEEVFYATTKDYGQYLTNESSDCFVVGILLMAIKLGQDIECDTISEKLYYNLVHTVIPILDQIYGGKEIKIHCKHLSNQNYQAKAVATGCSLGVDSFSTIIDHIGTDCSPSYRLTHFTYFNVGAHGDKNLDKVKESYDNDFKLVDAYAKTKKIPVVAVESNISKLYEGFDFNQCALIRNMSVVLSMQKLFRRYIYASSFHIRDTSFSNKDMHYQSPFLLPALSTETTELINGDPCLDRVNKTRKIADFEDTYKYLYVCWKELIANDGLNEDIAKVKDEFLNCTRCDKCLRTILTLDILGKKEKYHNIFDLKYYDKSKDLYVGKVIAYKRRETYYQEIYQLMKETDFPITLKARIYTFMWTIYKVIGFGVNYRWLRKIVGKC